MYFCFYFPCNLSLFLGEQRSLKSNMFAQNVLQQDVSFSFSKTASSTGWGHREIKNAMEEKKKDNRR